MENLKTSKQVDEIDRVYGVAIADSYLECLRAYERAKERCKRFEDALEDIDAIYKNAMHQAHNVLLEISGQVDC